MSDIPWAQGVDPAAYVKGLETRLADAQAENVSLRIDIKGFVAQIIEQADGHASALADAHARIAYLENANEIAVGQWSECRDAADAAEARIEALTQENEQLAEVVEASTHTEHEGPWIAVAHGALAARRVRIAPAVQSATETA